MLRIGIDVGGTSTDAVILEHADLVAKVKTATTEDVVSGVSDALDKVLRVSGVPSSRVVAVMIGTTHFTNAVIERRGLAPVASVRIGLPASRSLGPFSDWPVTLSRIANGGVYPVHGGHEVDGREILPLDPSEIECVGRRIAESGVSDIAVSSAFSPIVHEHELRVAEILARHCPESRITLSHRIGRIGLLERENATILNASLRPLAMRATAAFNSALDALGLEARLFHTLNDGTVQIAEQANHFPVFSLASGPTNSMRGAAYLSGRSSGIVIDVGGTSTEFGVLENGFPREANNVIEIGGVRTLFRMPDLISIALGGGSLINSETGRIGPESTGFALLERGRVFGGTDLTATDIAVAAGLISLGNRSLIDDLPDDSVDRMLRIAHTQVIESVDRIKTEAGDTTILAVGGGSFLVPDQFDGASEVIRLEHGEVANAVGAAMAQIAGTCDEVFTDLERSEMLARGVRIASQRAIQNGASEESLQTIEIEDLPLAYLPGNAVRVRVRVVGDVDANYF